MAGGQPVEAALQQLSDAIELAESYPTPERRPQHAYGCG